MSKAFFYLKSKVTNVLSPGPRKQLATNKNMKCTQQVINKVFQNANLPSWKYRKVDLGLTQTDKEKGRGTLNGLDREKFGTIFKRHDNQSKPVGDNKRLQYNEVLNDIYNTTKAGHIKKAMKNLQQEVDFIYPDLEICYVSCLLSLPGGQD